MSNTDAQKTTDTSNTADGRVSSGTLLGPMEGVREYAEGMSVELVEDGNRVCVKAKNEAGYNSTMVDLGDLVAWLKRNRPDLLA